MKHTQSGNLGWKKFWRENFSQFSDNLDNIYTDSPFKNNPNQRLLFDGVRNAQENTTSRIFQPFISVLYSVLFIIK